MYCYGLSARSSNPFRIQLLNYSDEHIKLSSIDGFKSWNIDFIEQPPETALYLTADAS